MNGLLAPNKTAVDHITDVRLSITVGFDVDGALHSSVQFPTGEVLAAKAGDPDLGFDEANTVLHDVVHTLLAARLGLDRSPVLERVVNLRPLSQRDVDLEETATFALQAWMAGLRGESFAPAVANTFAALQRLRPERVYQNDPDREHTDPTVLHHAPDAFGNTWTRVVA